MVRVMAIKGIYQIYSIYLMSKNAFCLLKKCKNHLSKEITKAIFPDPGFSLIKGYLKEFDQIEC